MAQDDTAEETARRSKSRSKSRGKSRSKSSAKSSSKSAKKKKVSSSLVGAQLNLEASERDESSSHALYSDSDGDNDIAKSLRRSSKAKKSKKSSRRKLMADTDDTSTSLDEDFKAAPGNTSLSRLSPRQTSKKRMGLGLTDKIIGDQISSEFGAGQTDASADFERIRLRMAEQKAQLKQAEEERIESEVLVENASKHSEQKKDERRRKKKAEKKLAEEAEARKFKEDNERRRRKEEARVASEARRIRELKEEERKRQEAERKSLAEEAERIRLEEEAARRQAAEEAERIRLEEEAAKQQEAERIRLEEEATRKREAEEAERIRLEKEARTKREAQEAERVRLEEEAAMEREAEEFRLRKEKEEMERIRKQEEMEELKRRRAEKELLAKKQAEERAEQERARAREERRRREAKDDVLRRLQKARQKMVTNFSEPPPKTRAQLAKEAFERPPQPAQRAGPDVFQKPLPKTNPKTYEAPLYEKSIEEERTIERALSRILPLDLMPKSNVSKLIGAFEKQDYLTGTEIELVKAPKDRTGEEDDEEREDDFFYVVEKGSVTVEVDGQEVAQAREGDTVGNTHLYHGENSADRQRSIMRINPIRNGQGASLMRIDQRTYRTIMQTEQAQLEQDKLDLVENMPLFENLRPELRRKLAAALKKEAFTQGDMVQAKSAESGKDLFCVVSCGRLVCRGGERTDLKKSDANPNATRPVERGGFFGDHVLQPAGDLMWLDTPLKVKAAQSGHCYIIDRPTFETVVGHPKDVLLTPEAARNIQRMDILKSHPGQKFTLEQMRRIQAKIQESFYEQDQTIIESDIPVEAALYYIRQGSVKIMSGRFHRLKIAGGFFGEDLFQQANSLGQSTGTISNAVVAKVDCICGKLRVEDVLSLQLGDLSFAKKDTEQLKSPTSKKKVVMLTKKEKAERLLKKQDSKKAVAHKTEETKVLQPKPKPSDDASVSSSSSASSGSSDSSSSSSSSSSVKRPLRKPTKKDDGPPISEIRPEAAVLVEEEIEEIEYVVPKRSFKMDNLEKRVLLGEGQFGQVWLVTDKSERDNRAYALKIQSKYDLVAQAQAEICIRETNIMSQMHHPHIIKLFGSFQDPAFVYIVLEMVNGGELFNRIHPMDEDYENTPQDRALPEDHAKFYSFIIADMLKYMHEKRYVYRDLKPENVLIAANGFPVLIDFGFTKKLHEKTYTLCGTPGYLAPEMITSEGHSFGVDHWALGILTYEMICKYNFFNPEGMDDPVTLYKCIAEDEFEPPADRLSSEGCDYLDQLLKKDPIMRLGSLSGGENDVLTHPWFKGLDSGIIRKQKLTPPWVPDIKDPLDTSCFEDWSELEDKTQERYPTLSDAQAMLFEDF